MDVPVKNPLTFILLYFLIFVGSVNAGPEATIDELAWMTGTWSAQLGPNTLEEHWVAPQGGSIAAMVRMTGNGATSMFEVITIEEKDGSLVMNVQQWNAGFEPRTAVAQKLELAEIGERMVRFTAVTEGSMTSLGYSRTGDSTFTIHLETPDGNKVNLDLQAR